MQSRWDSLREILAGTVIGLIGNWIIAYLVSKYCAGWEPSAAATLIVIFATIWSISRNYCLRRRFNQKSVEQQAKGKP